MKKITIEFYTKNNYGTPMEYIADEKFAEIFRKLTGKKTISEYEKKLWTKLGIEFNEIIQPKYEKFQNRRLSNSKIFP